MKLYLSSIGIPDSKTLLSLIDPNQLSVAIIPNAWDVYPEDRKTQETENIRDMFSKLGFIISVIDLRVTKDEKLKVELSKKSLIWVMGGNSFYLNQMVHESGLANIATELLAKGLVYGGESAGAVLAGPTLHGVEVLDDPKKASKIIWDGLKLVNFGVVPHWGMEKYTDLLNKCKNEMEKYSKVKTLTNNQALIIQGNKISLVGR